MPFILALFLGLLASVANADFYTGVLQQQAQHTPTGGGGTPVVASYWSDSAINGAWIEVSITKPTGTAENDIVLAAIMDAETSPVSPFPSVPDGSWSTLESGESYYYTRLWTYGQVAGASEPASWTFGAVSGGSFAVGSAIRITGASSIEASAVASSAVGPVNCPSVTTLGDNRLVITYVITGNYDGDTVITPAGTLIDSGTRGVAKWAVDYREQVSAGASGTITHSVSGTPAIQWTCVTIGVAP